MMLMMTMVMMMMMTMMMTMMTMIMTMMTMMMTMMARGWDACECSHPLPLSPNCLSVTNAKRHKVGNHEYDTLTMILIIMAMLMILPPKQNAHFLCTFFHIFVITSIILAIIVGSIFAVASLRR